MLEDNYTEGINLDDEQKKCIHKVIKRRVVKKDGLEAYRLKLLGMPHDEYSDFWEIAWFYPLGVAEDFLDKIGIMNVYIQSLILGISFPFLSFFWLAYIPVGYLRKANCMLRQKELYKLDYDVYKIMCDRIGDKGYNDANEIEQQILSDIKKAKVRKR